VPLFVYIGRDSARGLELRKQHRPAHLDHIATLGSRVRFGGPLLDENGNPCGSLVILEDDDLASARKTAESDPYLVTGVFESVEVNETKQVVPDPGEG
jgi:uncharacterized protein YciI